jgi:hypothetical protein
VPQGKLLGFIVSHRRIEANPKKINAIIALEAPKMIKDIQKLTGCMADLNRFISRHGERRLPFFKLLKHHDKFKWTEEANQVLQDDRRMSPDFPRGTVNLIGGELDVDELGLRTNGTSQS